MQNTNNLCMGCMSEKGNEAVCPVCGFDPDSYNVPGALALKTMLANRYIIGRVITSNGQGFQYLGYDTVADAVVKINEYFPTGLCERMPDGSVLVNGETAFIYNEGIIQFIELYKKLGSLGEVSALYRIIDLFETQKTAYCVSEYLPGISLKEFLLRNGGVLKWEQMRLLFLPLIASLKTLHANNIIHGGISPETLAVGRDGHIRITDFCIESIRKAKSDMTSQLFSGYAAIEQYEGEKLTPATDVYGFAATLFRTLTGNTVPDVKQRVEHDNMTFPKSIAEQLPRGVLIAMANALQINPEDRTRNMEELRSDILSMEETLDSGNRKSKSEKGKSAKNSAQKAATKKYTLIASLATALVLIIIALLVYFVTLRRPQENTPSSSLAMPSTVSVGDIGNSQKPESYYSVPNFSGSTLSSLLNNEEYDKWFEFVVVKKEYSDKIARGKICGQSVAAGTAAKKDTKVGLAISLGPQKISVPKKLKGMTKTEAYIALLELGFDPANIEFIEKKESTPTKEEVVLDTSPSFGSTVNPDESIIVYYNTNLIIDDSSDPINNTDDN